MRKFYKCSHCGNIVIKIKDSGVRISCCYEEMKEIPINRVEEGHEKHVPQISFSNNLMNVSIGSITHPMTNDHLIEWVFVEYGNGGEFVFLNGEPFVTINVIGKVVKNVYSYCNLHGLWVSEVKE